MLVSNSRVGYFLSGRVLKIEELDSVTNTDLNAS